MNNRNFFLVNLRAILLKNSIDIKNIVIDRPHPQLLGDVPIVCIYSGAEDPEKRSGGGGNEYIVDTYNNDFGVNIDVIVTNITGADMYLNTVCGQIEDALNADIFFKKITGEKQPDNKGLKLGPTKPYTFDDGGENSYAASNMSINIGYITDAIPELRQVNLEGVDGKINRVGYDEDTVDPTLMNVKIDTNT